MCPSTSSRTCVRVSVTNRPPHLAALRERHLGDASGLEVVELDKDEQARRQRDGLCPRVHLAGARKEHGYGGEHFPNVRSCAGVEVGVEDVPRVLHAGEPHLFAGAAEQGSPLVRGEFVEPRT